MTYKLKLNLFRPHIHFYNIYFLNYLQQTALTDVW